MKKILFAALAAATVALPSCSSDETVDVEKGAAIQLNVSSSRISRSSVVTEGNITEFHMWANASNKTDGFFINHKVTKEETSWNYGSLQFWPQTAAVDFVAVYPASLANEGNASGTVTTKFGMVGADNAFSIDYTVSGAEDFAYAANYGETKKNTAVQLNFRHALSQIVFKAFNSNTEVLAQVKIKEVKIVNVKSKGTFTWATKDTNKKHIDAEGGDNYLHNDHTGVGDDTKEPIVYDETWGSWANLSAPNSYVNNFVSAGEVVLDKNHGNSAANPVDLTQTKKGTEADQSCTGGLLLLPQEIKSWDTTAAGKATQSYFAIKCQIVAANGSQLYPAESVADGYDYVLIPVPAIIWTQGMRYTYIFNFGKGAGWTPGENPEPVLYGISVTVTVDEFQSANDIPVTMETGKEGGK